MDRKSFVQCSASYSVYKKHHPDIAKRSTCPIATALDIFGDKWTLLIVRDIGLFDLHRNKEFQEGDEGIPSNILASRLNLLVDNGLVVRKAYQNNPPRYDYHLTQRGMQLVPLIKSMAKWATTHVAGVKIPVQNQGN